MDFGSKDMDFGSKESLLGIYQILVHLDRFLWRTL